MERDFGREMVEAVCETLEGAWSNDVVPVQLDVRTFQIVDQNDGKVYTFQLTLVEELTATEYAWEEE